MSTLQAIGQASCTGGFRPDPSIDAFPLLVCVNGEIKTEDGKISAFEMAREYERRLINHPDGIQFMPCRLGWHYDTSLAHVRQALAYAMLAGWLG